MISGSISGTAATLESLRSTPEVNRICGRAAKKSKVSPFMRLLAGVVEEGRQPCVAAETTATRLCFSLSQVLDIFSTVELLQTSLCTLSIYGGGGGGAGIHGTRDGGSRKAGGGLVMGWNIVKYIWGRLNILHNHG